MFRSMILALLTSAFIGLVVAQAPAPAVVASPDTAALLALKAALLAAPQADPESQAAVQHALKFWIPDTDPCDPVQGPWPRLQCSGAQVTKLNLSGTHLAGPVPSAVGLLTALDSLDLSNNDLVGEVPQFLTNLTGLGDLRLDLNQLSGTIPEFLGGMMSLTCLQLSGNTLTSSIPAALASLTGLRRLALSSNDLSGSLPDLSPLTQLTWLGAAVNALEGSLPDWLGRMPSLAGLVLRSNSFQGTIPDLSGSSNLTSLFLSNTGLSGSLPPSLGLLTNLELLYASQNALEGGVPEEFGNMQKLRQLDLSMNSGLGGTLPVSLGNLPALELLALSGCGLSGTLPEGFGELANLKELHLDSNILSGGIPAEYGSLGQLSQLSLAQNRLQGPLPSELCSLARLNTLDLGTNQLNGTLPACLVGLPWLRSLSVSRNQFWGPLPSSVPSTLRFSYDHNCFFSPAPDQDSCALAMQVASGSLPSWLLWLLINLGLLIFVAVMAVTLYWCVKKRRGPKALMMESLNPFSTFRPFSPFPAGPRRSAQGLAAVKEFSMSEIEDATRSFSAVYGRGAFGTVYMAMGLPGLAAVTPGQTSYRALVRRATNPSVLELSERAFREKVACLAAAHHRYIVRLQGFCVTTRERILVHEYLAKGTLHRYLHSREDQLPLPWAARVRVAATLATALDFLHHGLTPPFPHGHVTSTNVLLSTDGCAKLSELGLGPGTPGGMGMLPPGAGASRHQHRQCQRKEGQPERLSEGQSPRRQRKEGQLEYLEEGQSPRIMPFSPDRVPASPSFSDHAGPSPEQQDVYDFGVVCLELISGQQVEHEGNHITAFAAPFLDNPNIVQLMVDPQIGSSYNSSELLVLASVARSCVQQSFALRPTMREVKRRMEDQLFLEQGIFNPPDPDASGEAATCRPRSEGSGFGLSSRSGFQSLQSVEMLPVYEPGAAPTSLGIRAHGQGSTLETMGSAIGSLFQKSRG